VTEVGPDLMTGHPGIFAGGDMVPSERTVTVAIGHGKKAARNVDAYLRGGLFSAPGKHPLAGFGGLNTWYYADAPATVRPTLEAARRVTTFDEVMSGLDESTALVEARRCMPCGNCFGCDNRYGVCPDNAIVKLADGQYAIDDDYYCKGCGLCAAECPCGAIEMEPEQALNCHPVWPGNFATPWLAGEPRNLPAEIAQSGWMRRPLIRVGVMRTYTSRAPAAHGRRCVRFCNCSTSRSSVTSCARPCTRTLHPAWSASSRQSASKLTCALAYRARSVSGAVRKMTVFAVTAKFTGSITIPSAAANPTRPIPPGSSRSKHSAGLSLRRACPFRVAMDVHLRRRRSVCSFSLLLAHQRALRPDVPPRWDVRPDDAPRTLPRQHHQLQPSRRGLISHPDEPTQWRIDPVITDPMEHRPG
jgi:Pyruvate/2-oxoacid:ferredoxin oxidoreductase delta subunit